MRSRSDLVVLVVFGLYGLVRVILDAPAVIAAPSALGIASLCASGVLLVVAVAALALELRRRRRKRAAEASTAAARSAREAGDGR
ncbi:hypothetical protein [Rathayibacter festucae]|uniref:hypothetical protein n=1 Tax=Rathayibacter festucae TaxID=110937 RepID=UPI002A69D6BE|nr:hypothetical protein [Rathayibacter festucae]MDY0911479.1 hypothetical protein [Rathayibacter festucae]